MRLLFSFRDKVSGVVERFADLPFVSDVAVFASDTAEQFAYIF